ncbi:MAG: transglycosylase SLT domain-containing protein [Candidatus Promineofilum sp.]|uniref:transglycosylase SLT domain-containing protein n=1 Tax=Promineifilum sp. TaxID=2664178 RepID=UPI002412020E|nr:transglycosylase SLT domain-containing protein [Promineifilum sp.]MCO5181796.1 transglycosylase SLT domain-containing protein [Promineifilum sp.]
MSRYPLAAGLVIATCLLSMTSVAVVNAHSALALLANTSYRAAGNVPSLSPYWGPEIQQWGDYIVVLSEAYGFHPDFVAAVILHESPANNQAGNAGGAAPLMGFSPGIGDGGGMASSGVMATPPNNLRWGMAILSYVVQQTGGDLFLALAAYNGGWSHVNNLSPQAYAASVLDSYARALIVRDGLSPQMANSWTLAVEIRAGNVPADSVLILGNRPINEAQTFAEHTVYAFANQDGRVFFVRGYVVPLGLSEYAPDEQAGVSDQLEGPLRARLGEKSARSPYGNPRVLLACLPSLSRLRGQLMTRWYAPSDCPTSGR